MMDKNIVISVDHISKKFCKSLKRGMVYTASDISRNLVGLKARSDQLRKGEFWAVDDISFDLRRGETLGLIGSNGAGKTTLLQMLSGIFWPDKGEINIKGRVGALIAVGAGFHPMLSGRENVYLNAAILGMSRREVEKKFNDIIEFAEIGDFIDTPVKYYSSGMFVRLGFSVAIHCEPEVLLVDEVLAVGDIAFKRKCFKKLGELKDKKIPWILVTHDIGTMRNQADRVLVMAHGKKIFLGDADEALSKYIYSISEAQSEKIQQTKQPSSLYGSVPEVEILDVVLEDEDGNLKESFTTGEAFAVRIDYRTNGVAEDPVFGIRFIGGDGEVATGINSRVSDYSLGDLEGTGSVYFSMPWLPFFPGAYRVAVTAHDKNLGRIHELMRPVILRVERGKFGIGLFNPQHSWRLVANELAKEK